MPGGMPPQQQQPPAFPSVPGGMPPQQQQQSAFPSMPGGFPPQQQRPPSMPNGMPPPQQQQPPAFPSMPGGFPPQQQQPPAFPSMPGGFPPQQQQPPAFPSMPGGFPPQQHQQQSPAKFMRSTLYAVPQTNDMTKATQLPLSLAICPFAKLHQSEYPPPVIDLGDIGPVRCQRCKAYMCPFMEFVDGGRKFRCPFCHANTPVEDGYFAHLDHTGRRTDIQHRPELFLGSYEFVATKQYCKNGTSPKQPAFIFMLDVSYNAVRSGMVELFCRNIMDMLRELPRENFREGASSMRIGLATYDQTVHFYNLSQPNRAEMLVVSDIADVFVPFVDGFLVELEQAESALSVCLREIAGLDALSQRGPGLASLFIFHTSLPVLGGAPGQLKSREDRKLLGTDKEKTILSPATDFYSKLGEECVKWGCAVDLFLFPNAFVDVASIAPAVSTTGGIVYKYQYFDKFFES
uniref:Protein transport protein Sec24-like CEF n=1 Tax=Globodera pallida TaxID=36090 RepID=A0A183BK90_GLOPA